MSKILYFLATFAELGLAVFGIRGAFATPGYTVVQQIAPDIEIRAYGPRSMVQTAMTDGGEGEAFGKLFRYITGANAGGRTIPMTVPVEQAARAAGTPPGPSPSGTTMAFYLPPDVAAHAPVPKEPGVEVVLLPAATLGVIRFSGTATEDVRARRAAQLTQALHHAGRTLRGAPMSFSYDPPFTIPALRRNEVAIEVAP